MRCWVAALLCGLCAASGASQFDYQLVPRKIADGVYAFIGKTEDFTRDNGGNVVNTGFIVTGDGVLVIDTGPTRRYGEQMRAAIAKVTKEPIALVINTHFHPDHFLGNQAFADVEIAALPKTIAGIRESGNDFSSNIYRMSGEWASGTEALTPSRELTASEIEIGNRRISLLAFSGHTAGDAAVFDVKTGTLFAGDLVFFDRSPTTPHADLSRWLESLAKLEDIPFTILVPGHGQPVAGKQAIVQTREYLRWLGETFTRAAEQGLDMTELLAQRVPEKFRSLSLVETEFRRSIAHLYPDIEQSALKK